MSTKDPYEGTLQFGLSPKLVGLLQDIVTAACKGSVPQSDQELLDLVTVGYKLGRELEMLSAGRGGEA